MAKKSIIPGKANSYNWTFASIGGVTRVTINSGEDIAHLGELDQKLWTVLSCPVKGLEFDAETLRLMDTDNDGKIRVNEVVAASQWLCGTLKNPDRILDGADHIALADLSEGDDGAAVCSAAQRILQRKGVEAAEISMADVAEAKAAFDENCAEAVDVSVEKIQAISEMNLATCSDKIADYPLARPNKEMRLTMGAGINPAWQAAFDKAKSLVLTVDYPEADSIDEAQWNAVCSKLDAYVASLADDTSYLITTMSPSATSIRATTASWPCSSAASSISTSAA